MICFCERVATGRKHCVGMTEDKSKTRKSVESRTRQILEPNTLTEDQFDEHWRGVTVEMR